MSSKLFLSNFENKSELIRRVYEKSPTATNRQIKIVIKNSFGIDVNSNLIIAAIGKYKTRIALCGLSSNIVRQAKQYLGICLGDVEQAIHFLKKAKAS